MIALIAVALIPTLAAAVFLVWAERRSGLRHYAKVEVIVHTPDHTIRGVLVGRYRDCWVLAHASYRFPAGDEQIAGEAVIPTERIGWVQVVAGEER